MTQYFMYNETGSVFSLTEVYMWFEYETNEETFKGTFENYMKNFTEVRPIVDNPDESNTDDWEAI